METQRKNFNKTRKSNQKGFSLIELIIVMVVMGIIAAIAIPNLTRSRMAANEASAVKTIRTVHSGQIAYEATVGGGEYTDLATLMNFGYIDSVLGTAPNRKSGFTFEVDVLLSTNTEDARFNLRARPVVHFVASAVTATGSRDFGTTESGLLFQTTDNTAVTFDPITRQEQGTAVTVGE